MVEAHEIIISPALCCGVKLTISCILWRNNNNDKKKKKKKNTKESDNSRKWKLIEEEVNELKRKKSLLGGTIRELHDDADRFVFEVENSKDLESMKSLLTKSKSFHTTAKKKKKKKKIARI